MAFKEILQRIKRLEEKNNDDEIVVLICLENGREKRKSMSAYEAQMLVLNQSAAKTFGSDIQLEIVGVESGDDDGFIESMLNDTGVTPEEVQQMIEVLNDEHI